MAITITDWGIEHNGVKKYNGPFVAGPGSGFKIWAIVEQPSAGLKTADGYDWILSDGGHFLTADAGGEYTSLYNASVIENWIQGVT